jgi:hypothetical protein
MWEYNYDYLCHHGIKGQKWGVRRFQNYDGTLTQEGKEKHKEENHKKLSDEQRKAIRNAVIAAAAVTAIGVGAYYANKYRNTNLDKVLKSGINIQHMSRTSDEILNKPFYASYLKKDNKSYAKNDFLGAHWNYKMTLSSQKDLKIAGVKTAEKAYKEWLNSDPSAKARFGNSSYFSFNRNLNSPSMYDKKFYNDFYNVLKEKGYDAIHDRNDQMQSGTTAPLIIFGSLGELSIKDIEKAAKKVIS